MKAGGDDSPPDEEPQFVSTEGDEGEPGPGRPATNSEPWGYPPTLYYLAGTRGIGPARLATEISARETRPIMGYDPDR